MYINPGTEGVAEIIEGEYVDKIFAAESLVAYYFCDRDYPEPLRDLGVPILLVGVAYDPKTKEHRRRIEKT